MFIIVPDDKMRPNYSLYAIGFLINYSPKNSFGVSKTSLPNPSELLSFTSLSHGLRVNSKSFNCLKFKLSKYWIGFTITVLING